MDRDRLERYLVDGLSLSEIGVLENRDPSTVGYWVEKFGLVANGREKYAPKGGIEREALQALVEKKCTLKQIAAELNCSSSTVRYWLRKYELKLARAQGRRALALDALKRGEKRFEFDCRHHGRTVFLVFAGGRSRCAKCNTAGVQRRRERNKEELASEAGGMCAICGYRRYLGALQFHHVDRATKAFGISGRGYTRALDRSREEAKKCILLCANCHAEVEGGVTPCPRLE